MARFLPDTSCMVAVLCNWHEGHQSALHAIESRLDAGDEMVVAGPTLVETYAVPTRLPLPHRLAPQLCLALLQANFIGPDQLSSTLSAGAYHQLLHDAASKNIAGGALYDAVIAACAVAGGVDTLLTFNLRDFERLTVPELSIVLPE